MTSQTQTKTGLKREVKWYVPVSLVVGTLGSTGIFGLIPATYEMAGPGAALVWVITLLWGFVIAMLLAYNFTIWPDKTGAEYAPVRIALGKVAGVIAGWGFFISWGTSGAVAGLILARYVFGAGAPPIHSQLFTFALLTIFFALNMFGIKIAGLAQTALAVLKVVPLVIVGLAALPLINPANFSPLWIPGIEGVNVSDPIGVFNLFMATALIATWSTYATDIFASIASEVVDPQKSIPRAGAVASITSLVYIALIAFGAVGVVGEGLAQLPRPLFILGERALGSAGTMLLWIALFFGALGVVNTALLSGARILYQMAVEGDLPSIFARVNKYNIPWINLTIIYIINVLMLFYTPLYVILVAIVQVPWMITWFLIGLANIKIRMTPKWHQTAAFKAPWWLIILGFIVSVLSLYFIYSYGVLYGWSDIQLGFGFVVFVLIILGINELTKRK
ncbi:MAG: APC family permease [Desulfurococcaceae archaeon]